MVTTENNPILELKGVSCGYVKGVPIIKDISLRVDKPGLICIIGPNGVGKSTLIRCIDGLIKPSEGSITVMGRPLEEYNLKDLAKVIGYVPVMKADSNVMKVIEAVIIGRYAHQKVRTTHHDIEVAVKALRSMEIEDLAQKNVNELSAGQHQKVAISRGLAQEPQILILDEPTANLDVRHQVYVSAFLKVLSAKTGMTVLMISHDLNLASKYADTLIVMQKPGVIHSIGAPSDIVTREMIREVYGVDCVIADDNGKPYVILQDVL